MTQALSVDLRERVVRFVTAGHSCRSAAAKFDISARSAERFAALARRTGSVVAKPQGGDRRSKLGPAQRDFVLQRVREQPDITLTELAAELAGRGVVLHISNLCRFLRAQGLRYKKNTGGRRTTSSRYQSGAARMDDQAPTVHEPFSQSSGVSR